VGSELVTGSTSPAGGGDNPAPISYTKVFIEQLPFYMSIGMTYDEFWYDDCCKAKYYRQAFEISKNRKNQEMWIMGAYVYEAICDVSPVLHAFAKSNTKPLPYLSEPFPLSKKEAEDMERAKEATRIANIKARMSAWASAVNVAKEDLGKGGETNGWKH